MNYDNCLSQSAINECNACLSNYINPTEAIIFGIILFIVALLVGIYLGRTLKLIKP